jgi:hypothetical protein
MLLPLVSNTAIASSTPAWRRASGSAGRRLWPVGFSARQRGPRDTGHLLARAEATTFFGSRGSSPSNHVVPNRWPGLASLTTEVAPSISNWRNRSLPWGEIPPSRGLPPVEFCFCVNPS